MISDQDLIDYLAQTLPPTERDRVGRELRGDRETRDKLWDQLRIDLALRILHGDQGSIESVKQAVMTELKLESLSAAPAFEEHPPGEPTTRPIIADWRAWLASLSLISL